MKITSRWTTYRTTPYSPVTADDGAAAGNVVHYQARRVAGGPVICRRVASNGRHTSAGQTWEADELDIREIADAE